MGDIGDFLAKTSPLYGAISGKGTFGGLNKLADKGGFGALGLALGSKKKPKVGEDEEKPTGAKCGGKVKNMAKGGDTGKSKSKGKSESKSSGGSKNAAANRAALAEKFRSSGPPPGLPPMPLPPPPMAGPPPGMPPAPPGPPPGAAGPPPGMPPAPPMAAPAPPGMPPAPPPGAPPPGMRKGGGVKKFDTGGDTFKPSSGIKFVSNPVVQDTSKMDRSADDAANAAREKRLAAAKPTASSVSRSRGSGSVGSGGSSGASSAKKRPLSQVDVVGTSRTSVAGGGGSKGPSAASGRSASSTDASGSEGSKARAGIMGNKAIDYISKTAPVEGARRMLSEGASRLFKPDTDENQAKTLARLKSAATGPNASTYDKDRYRLAKQSGTYAKGGKTENPFAKFAKKAAAPDKKPEPPFKKRENPFSAGKPSAITNKPNPFAKVKGSEKSGGSTAKGKPFAKGGKVDGCAIRGKTKAKRST